MKPKYRRNSVLKILLCLMLVIGGCGFANHVAFSAQKTAKVPRWGLVVQDMNDDMLESVGLKERNIFGVIITQVLPNSPATLARLKQGDVIIAINGQELHSYEGFEDLTEKFRIGETAILTVWRDSMLQKVTLIPVDKQQSVRQQFNDQLLQGAEFSETDNGVFVQKPDHGGLFAKDDQVLRLNGRVINSINDINTALESDRQSISVEVRRNGALISRSFSAGQNGNFFSQSIIVR
jgi:S1-C subfamily serine protease